MNMIKSEVHALSVSGWAWNVEGGNLRKYHEQSQGEMCRAARC
jgi:hypothetical protein